MLGIKVDFNFKKRKWNKFENYWNVMHFYGP